MIERPTATFVGVTYAGWSTRQQNLERHVRADGRLDADFHEVNGWTEGGFVERLPLPTSFRGRLRSTWEAHALVSLPRSDVVWTSAPQLLLPYLWAFSGPLQRPLVLELDWTVEQQEAMATWYFGRPPRTGRSLARALARQRRIFRHVTLFTPMSNWAADGLRAAGVPDDRILVLHPGIDLQDWPHARRPASERGPLRLLFVGGDLVRKGGDLLCEAIAGPLAGRAVADVVTRDPVDPVPGVVVHRCEPNSPELRERYAEADIFVMPTRADCFGHAVVEAMASGLPAIVGDVGGVGDIVDDGVNGWRIEPTLPALHDALENALVHRRQLPEMGAAARRTAETKFDGHQNDRRLVEAMLHLAERGRSTPDARARSEP